ncbi:MAG TPA: type II toxin-antitoxin system VapC family toxin [Mucilaginibacter sp.]|nr:type II toxin-antitoxin system VapC family toxin [Mucilaginibacter sp.]
MYLIDNNIIIYSYLSDYKYLRDLFVPDQVVVSEISRVEVLGYNKITKAEESYFQDIFRLIPIILPSQAIFDAAIIFRKMHKLSLGDSLIAGTAMVHNLTIYTKNFSDFKKLTGIDCIDPVK